MVSLNTFYWWNYVLVSFPMGNISCFFVVICWFFHNQLLPKKNRNTISFKQFGSRSGAMFCWASSGSKLFTKVISRRHWEIKVKLFACWVCCCLLTFFIITFFKKSFQEHVQSVKQFEIRSGPTFCRSWSRSKLFVKVISRRHWEIKVKFFACWVCCRLLTFFKINFFKNPFRNTNRVSNNAYFNIYI